MKKLRYEAWIPCPNSWSICWLSWGQSWGLLLGQSSSFWLDIARFREPRVFGLAGVARSPWPADQASAPPLTFLASLCIYLAVCLANSVFPSKREEREIGLESDDNLLEWKNIRNAWTLNIIYFMDGYVEAWRRSVTPKVTKVIKGKAGTESKSAPHLDFFCGWDWGFFSITAS